MIDLGVLFPLDFPFDLGLFPLPFLQTASDASYSSVSHLRIVLGLPVEQVELKGLVNDGTALWQD